MKSISYYLVSEWLLSLIFFAAALDKLVASHGITADDPGIAILVRNGQHVLLKKGYVLVRLRDRTPITPKTHFELASVS